MSDRGTPVFLRDVADVRMGPELRRGIADLNGDGSFEYTHDGSGNLTDSFQYRASDGGLSSGPATVTIVNWAISKVQTDGVMKGRFFDIDE